MLSLVRKENAKPAEGLHLLETRNLRVPRTKTPRDRKIAGAMPTPCLGLWPPARVEHCPRPRDQISHELLLPRVSLKRGDPLTPRFEDSTGYAGTRNSRNAKISDVYGADIAKLPRVSSKRGVKPRDLRSRGPPADSFHAKGRPAMGKTLYKKLEFNF